VVVGESEMENGCGFVFGPTLRTTWVYELNHWYEWPGWGIKGPVVVANWWAGISDKVGSWVPGPKWLKKEAGKVANIVGWGFFRGGVGGDSPRLNSKWAPFKFFNKFWDNAWTSQTHGGWVVRGFSDIAHAGLGGALGLWSQGQGYSREDAMSLSIIEHFIIFESVVEAYEPWEYGDLMSDLYGVMSVY